jgi:hypothetical protein
VPCSLEAAYQSREAGLLNLYIKSRNGDPAAQAQWREVLGR